MKKSRISNLNFHYGQAGIRQKIAESIQMKAAYLQSHVQHLNTWMRVEHTMLQHELITIFRARVNWNHQPQGLLLGCTWEKLFGTSLNPKLSKSISSSSILAQSLHTAMPPPPLKVDFPVKTKMHIIIHHLMNERSQLQLLQLINKQLQVAKFLCISD